MNHQDQSFIEKELEILRDFFENVLFTVGTFIIISASIIAPLLLTILSRNN